MRYLVTLLAIGALIMLLQASSCKRKENNCTAIRVSILGVGNSHNNGQQCQSCHAYQGVGTGCFTVAGSIYRDNGVDPYRDGEIRLYTEPNGQGNNKGTLYTDARGNFYTTQSIDFSADLYPVLVDGDDNKYFMITPVTEGNCNRCHGEFAQRIKVD